MSYRLLFVPIMAIALLFAPFAMLTGMAMATPATHHGPMMDSGHCSDQPVKKTSHPVDNSCCAAMCTAVAPSPVGTSEPPLLPSLQASPAAQRHLHSFLAELPTPPPRRA